MVTSNLQDTANLYTEKYFQGGKKESNYENYIEQALGPSEILAETLSRFFAPKTVLDVGCAVGHTINKLRQFGIESYGKDISSWAVEKANRSYINRLDFSNEKINGVYDLVFSYDVVEHVLPDRLGFALDNMWRASGRHLLVVPAVYNNGETMDPNEPRHLIFKPYEWWVSQLKSITGRPLNQKATELFSKEYHSTEFNYVGRIMIFSR